MTKRFYDLKDLHEWATNETTAKVCAFNYDDDENIYLMNVNGLVNITKLYTHKYIEIYIAGLSEDDMNNSYEYNLGYSYGCADTICWYTRNEDEK